MQVDPLSLKYVLLHASKSFSSPRRKTNREHKIRRSQSHPNSTRLHTPPPDHPLAVEQHPTLWRPVRCGTVLSRFRHHRRPHRQLQACSSSRPRSCEASTMASADLLRREEEFYSSLFDSAKGSPSTRKLSRWRCLFCPQIEQMWQTFLKFWV